MWIRILCHIRGIVKFQFLTLKIGAPFLFSGIKIDPYGKG